MPRPVFFRYLISFPLLIQTLISNSYAATPAHEVNVAYQSPAPELQAIVDAPRPPQFLVAPDGHAIALVGHAPLPSIAIVSEPQARLAGIRFNPRTRLESRFEFGNALNLLNVVTRETHEVRGFPEGPRIVALHWSPDSRWLAVSLVEGDHVRLWLADTRTSEAHRATEAPLNAILGDGFAWLGGSSRLILCLRPEEEGSPPAASDVPKGPNVQSTDGEGESQLPTFEDLLKTPHDEDLLDYYLSAQIGILGIDGKLSRIGVVDRMGNVLGSPDGLHVLVTRLLHPYSRIVPISQFPTEVEVWDTAGRLIETVARTPLIEVIAPGADAVNPGPREIGWREDRPATVYWAESQDGGDPRNSTELRDIVYTATIPSGGRRTPLVKLQRRFQSIYWGRDDVSLVRDWTWKTRDAEIWKINPARPEEAPTLVRAWKSEDRYSDPGSPITRMQADGSMQLHLIGNSALMVGAGATGEGERPFLNRLDLDSGTATTVWRSAAPYYERPLAPLNDEGSGLLTIRESISTPPNLVLHASLGDEGVELTQFRNPTPELAGVTKELLHYQRADGLGLTAKLYLPPGYDSKRDGPLPMLLWAYPREFKSSAAASQVQGSPYKFNAINFAGPLPFLARGFAILDDPAMPIVGEGAAEPNDSYVSQLVADAQAAIDEVVRRGVADRNRIAIGGHSYGAFMTANLLAHSRLFKAGIARSGAYNRTLTPFGFQAEDRNFWTASTVYLAMSPFIHADQIHDPLLLIHGEIDNNSGTFPIQSERLYQAVKGLGGTTRLVMLPAESHGYRARESILHVLWEEDQWLTKYVKNASATDRP